MKEKGARERNLKDVKKIDLWLYTGEGCKCQLVNPSPVQNHYCFQIRKQYSIRRILKVIKMHQFCCCSINFLGFSCNLQSLTFFNRRCKNMNCKSNSNNSWFDEKDDSWHYNLKFWMARWVLPVVRDFRDTIRKVW
jgi:hypothetical protein